ncbi:MAG: SDR family oxidoreductase [Candidatus Aminicenantes bacterium]|nr:SDR family oxidoreductase [Candidatus Aminicenantes bacterium]
MSQARTNRIALVTGGSSAVGGAVAAALGRECAAVAIQYRADRAGALRAAAGVREGGAEAFLIRAALDRDASPAALAARVRRCCGRIDILVHTIGPFLQKRWDRLTPADWDGMFRSNLVSAHGLLLAVLPGMRRRKWGRVVFFGYGRVEQEAAFPGILAYAAAKAGLLLLTRTAGAAEAARGVTINMVSPGLLTVGARPSGLDAARHPLGTPQDVAAAVRFLASAEAARITGTNLTVAGTWKM